MSEQQGRGEVCPTCGHALAVPLVDRRITEQELNVLSAWWLMHSIRSTARFFGVAEQTVKNQLMDARRRNGFHSTAELAQAFMGQLRSMDELMAQHNKRARVA